MSASEVVLARKYRPKKLDQLIGQEVVVQTLKNAILNSRLHHAYLFTGQMGTGKTSMSRILAAMENCEVSPGLNPCGQCDICKEIFEGNHSDIQEIDAASEAGKVEQIRFLKKSALYSPIDGAQVKYFIIDECLPYSTRITLSDGNKITIGDLVENALSGITINKIVQSIDIETKEIIAQSICRYIKIPNNKQMYKLKIKDEYNGLPFVVINPTWYIPERIYVLRITGNHEVFVKEEGNISKTKTRNLKKGDKVFLGDQRPPNTFGEIISIEKIDCDDDFVYNLEIEATNEKNKNYFADGVLVSNCHAMSGGSNEALLKLIEEPPSKTRFILCIEKNEKVFDGDQFKAISEVKVNDKIYSEESYSEVIGIYNKGTAPVYRIRTRAGSTLIATKDHRIRVFNGSKIIWKSIADLNKDDYIVIHHSYNNKESKNNNYSLKECEFLGRLVGDGYYNKNHLGILFHEEEWEYGQLLLNDVEILYRSYHRGKVYECIIHERGKVYDRFKLPAYINGKKVLPNVVFTFDRLQMDAFLEGLIGADGHSDERGYRVLFSNNEQLVYPLKNLLTSFGYFTTLRYYPRTVHIDSITTSVKKGTYDTFILIFKTKKPRIPVSEDIRNYLQKNFKKSSILSKRFGSKPYRYGVTQEMINESDLIHLQNSCFYEKFENIEFLGEREVFDLEMRNNSHSFVVNNLSVHNCTTEVFKVKSTIISRCQRHDFVKIHWMPMAEALRNICKKENIEFEERAINVCSRMAQGSMRNAINNLDKLISFAGFKDEKYNKLTTIISDKCFGTVDENYFYDIIDELVGVDNNKKIDGARAFGIINKMLREGAEYKQIINGLGEHLQAMMITLTSSKAGELVYFHGENKDRIKKQIHKCQNESKSLAIINAIKLITRSNEAVSYGIDPELALQIWFVESSMEFKK